MFWDKRRKTEDRLFIVVKEQHGSYQIAMGDATKTYRDLRSAVNDAGRLATKFNDGKYFVFQAVSVSEVVSPRAVTRSLGDAHFEAEPMSTVGLG